MRVLITGVTGFVGSHAAELALVHGAEVFGACRWRSNTENIERFIMAGAPVCDRPKPDGRLHSAVSVLQ